MSDPVTYTGVLPVAASTVDYLARLLAGERARRGTRRGRRALEVSAQAVVVLRWFLDTTRVRQLARDSGISRATAYRYLHEGIDVLAATAPGLHGALLAARAAGYSRVHLDGTLITTTRSRALGPTPGGWTCGGQVNTAATAGTSRSSPHPMGGHCGAHRSAQVGNTT